MKCYTPVTNDSKATVSVLYCDQQVASATPVSVPVMPKDFSWESKAREEGFEFKSSGVHFPGQAATEEGSAWTGGVPTPPTPPTPPPPPTPSSPTVPVQSRQLKCDDCGFITHNMQTLVTHSTKCLKEDPRFCWREKNEGRCDNPYCCRRHSPAIEAELDRIRRGIVDVMQPHAPSIPVTSSASPTQAREPSAPPMSPLPVSPNLVEGVPVSSQQMQYLQQQMSPQQMQCLQQQMSPQQMQCLQQQMLQHALQQQALQQQMLQQQAFQPQMLQPQMLQPQVLQPQVLQPQRSLQPQVLQPQVLQPQVLQPQVLQLQKEHDEMSSRLTQKEMKIQELEANVHEKVKKVNEFREKVEKMDAWVKKKGEEQVAAGEKLEHIQAIINEQKDRLQSAWEEVRVENDKTAKKKDDLRIKAAEMNEVFKQVMKMKKESETWATKVTELEEREARCAEQECRMGNAIATVTQKVKQEREELKQGREELKQEKEAFCEHTTQYNCRMENIIATVTEKMQRRMDEKMNEAMRDAAGLLKAQGGRIEELEELKEALRKKDEELEVLKERPQRNRAPPSHFSKMSHFADRTDLTYKQHEPRDGKTYADAARKAEGDQIG